MNLQNAIIKGEFSPDSAFLYTYGMYLANGGTPEGFMEMSNEDVEMMHAAMVGTQMRERKELLEGIAKILVKVLGGKD